MKNPLDRTYDSQPTPIPNDGPNCQDYVIGAIEERKELGMKKYGTLLQPGNGRDMLQDAFEEALDMTVYLAGLLMERDS
jgi:hypothetical protein